MSKKPTIGITTYGVITDDPYNLPKVYVDAVVQSGGIPYLLPPTGVMPGDVMRGLDGLILSGGGDIDPAIYTEEKRHPRVYHVDPIRDTFELRLAEFVITHQLPCFGICRGCQVLNVSLGGSLYQHIPDHFDETVVHREDADDEDSQPVLHEVAIVSESKLATITNKQRMMISSQHHQAVEHLGDGLIAVAHSDDGLCEAIELPNHPWLLGVQWHPEHTAMQDRVQLLLFQDFIDFIRQQL